MSEDIQLIRLAYVMKITGLSKTGIYEAVKANNFPRQVKINRRSSAWVKSEVLDWVQSKMDVRYLQGVK